VRAPSSPRRPSHASVFPPWNSLPSRRGFLCSSPSVSALSGLSTCITFFPRHLDRHQSLGAVRRSGTAPSSLRPELAPRVHCLPAAVRCRTRVGPQRVAVFTAAVSAAAAALGCQALRPSYRDPRLATSGATPSPRLQGTKEKPNNPLRACEKAEKAHAHASHRPPCQDTRPPAAHHHPQQGQKTPSLRLSPSCRLYLHLAL
jgi:hypothetical protein